MVLSVKLSKDKAVRYAALSLPPLPGRTCNRTKDMPISEMVLLLPREEDIRECVTRTRIGWECATQEVGLAQSKIISDKIKSIDDMISKPCVYWLSAFKM